MIIVPKYQTLDHLPPNSATPARAAGQARPNGGLVALALARANPTGESNMKSAARAAAGRAAWASKSNAEKARIRARLAAGRRNAETRQNLTNHETRVISGILRGAKKGSSKSKSASKSTSKAASPKRSSAKSGKRPASAAQLANQARFAERARARAAAATTVKVSSRKASSKQSSARVRTPSAAQLAARQAAGRRLAEQNRLRALAARTAVDEPRGNLSPLERRKLKRLVGGSQRRRRTAASKMIAGRNRARAAKGLPPLKRHRAKSASSKKSSSRRSSSRKSSSRKRSNMYIPTRANMYIETRANPKRRRRGRGKARRNMYISRPNQSPGMQKLKTALVLTGLGLGSFMVTNVVQHYVGQQEFAQGAITDYGVPAALAALVWVGPTGKFLKGNKFVGRNGQIALTAGILGAVANRLLDGIVTNNLKALPGGEHLSNLLLGWPIVGKAELPVFGPAEGTAGVGEYVYDLPDSGMGEYIRDPQMHSVEREMKGLAYVDLQQRAANEEALRAANIRATQAATDNTSQYDDQFEPAY